MIALFALYPLPSNVTIRLCNLGKVPFALIRYFTEILATHFMILTPKKIMSELNS